MYVLTLLNTTFKREAQVNSLHKLASHRAKICFDTTVFAELAVYRVPGSPRERIDGMQNESRVGAVAFNTGNVTIVDTKFTVQ